MRIAEVISRRGFLKGVAGTAAAASLPAMAGSPDEQDIYWGTRQDYETAPRKLYPNVAVNRPNQYIKEMNVVVYDGSIFNQMVLQDFERLMKTGNKPDMETLPPNTIPGMNDTVYLTQIGNYNYFATQKQVNTFAQEHKVAQLVKRSYDTKQRMSRGDWGATGKGINKPMPNISPNTGDVQPPQYPWERGHQQNI